MVSLNSLPPIVALRRRFGARLSRTGYFVFGLLLNLGSLLVVALLAFVLSKLLGVSFEAAAGTGPVRAVDFGLGLVLAVLRQYLVVRRLHDFNRSGWWSLIFLIFLLPLPWPPLGYALTALSLVLVFVPGTHGPNRYGSRPAGSAPRLEGVTTLDGKPPF